MKPLIQSPASWQADSQAESTSRKGLFTQPRTGAAIGAAAILAISAIVSTRNEPLVEEKDGEAPEGMAKKMNGHQ